MTDRFSNRDERITGRNSAFPDRELVSKMISGIVEDDATNEKIDTQNIEAMMGQANLLAAFCVAFKRGVEGRFKSNDIVALLQAILGNMK